MSPRPIRDEWPTPRLTLAALLFLVPAVHPVFRPGVGVASHLLWWIHVLPVALFTYRLGKRAGIVALLLSAGLLVAGERTFGAGYGSPATWETTLSLAVALAFTHVLIGSFAVYARRTTRQLRHNALHDALTGLPNRRYIQGRLDELLREQRSGRVATFALLYLDLDDFKRINDSLGHSVGDAILREVSGRLRSSVRPGDVVARWGGDEFVILLSEVEDRAEAREITNRIQRSLEERIQASGHRVVVTASGGIALSSPRYSGSGELLRDADTALYRAKEEGKGGTEVFDPEMRSMVVRRLTLESELRKALDGDQFELHFQPVVRLADGRLRGLEALARWRHPERGLVSPGEFIPVAEETGLIVPLGEAILRRACAAARRWEREFPAVDPLMLSVNISAQQLHQADFVERLAEIYGNPGLRRNRLELEITETVLMRSAEQTVTGLDELKELGVALSVDDFGTGYSSLSYLHRFPVDSLKIDRSFVCSEENGVCKPEIARTIVALAEELELETVAEGVETEEQWETLETLGCTYAQGYLLARPMPREAAEDYLRESPRVPKAGTPAAVG